MSKKIRIAAGIVLYNPDEGRLRQNIEAILPQVDALYIVDNASQDAEAIDRLLAAYGLTAQRNATNAGIAAALNQLMLQGESMQMDWVLTLDQDSVCPPDLISTMRPFAKSQEQAGIICPVIVDRSFGMEHAPSNAEDATSVQECITSASLTRVMAWRQTGGFDERLFIDAVDTDFCLTLHEHGWQVLRINSLHLLHEIGHAATCHTLFGRTYIAFNHAPVRYYYIARNMVFLSRKHPGFLSPAPWRCMLTMMARMLVILCWEREDRWLKCRKIVSGIRNGINGKWHIVK